MYKIGSFEDELYRSMEKKLASNHLDKQHGLDKLAKATDYLFAAITLFEKAGMRKEARELDKILLNLSEELVNKL